MAHVGTATDDVPFLPSPIDSSNHILPTAGSLPPLYPFSSRPSTIDLAKSQPSQCLVNTHRPLSAESSANCQMRLPVAPVGTAFAMETLGQSRLATGVSDPETLLLILLHLRAGPCKVLELLRCTLTSVKNFYSPNYFSSPQFI